MKNSTRIRLALALGLCSFPAIAAADAYDLVIYGGTASGVAAAVQAARMGKSVALIEPTQHLGGLTTNGLSATDTGNTNAIQGLAREFYTKVGQAYGSSSPEFNFEPKVAETVINTWVNLPNISIFRGERLDLTSGVTKTGNVISAIRMEDGHIFQGSMFIDAGYEGDLMAEAGISFTTGREANSLYGERYNGVQTARATGHQFSTSTPVDPYVTPGLPSSGLLVGINPAPPAADGSGDSRIQSYNFRLTVTQAADRLPWTAPANYDASRYELLRRYIAANNITSLGSLLSIRSIKGGKFDINNNGPVSTDLIGGSYNYPNADYATRVQIVQDHRNYQQGLLYYLATDPAVPATLKTQMNSYGLCRDEFTDNGGWSGQLYIREARRMVGPYVMTDLNVMGQRDVGDSIALGSYTMDSHNAERYVDATGHVRNEGDVQITVPQPYGISYRSITPFESQAANLLVPTAISASHIALGSIRMEPVYMELGQAAGTAAALAIDNHTSVQALPYNIVRQRLVADGALVGWPTNADYYTGAIRADFNDYASASLPAGLRYQGGGSGFADNWDGTGTEYAVAGDLTTTRGGYAITQTGTGSAAKLQGKYNAVRQNYRTLQGKMAGSIWFSFLANNPDSTAACGISFNPTGNGDPANDTIRNFIELRGTNLRVTTDAVLTDNVASLAIAATHLFVGRLFVDPSGNDTFQLWADPADLMNLGPATYTSANHDWLTSLTKVGILSYNPVGSISPVFACNGGYVDSLILSNRDSYAFRDVTGVPEPTTASLVLIAAALAGGRRRRRMTR